MTVIVAARFDTFSLAEGAAGQLHANGFQDEDIATFYLEGYEARQSHDDVRAMQWGTAAAAAGIGLLFAVVCGFVVWRLNDAILLVVAGAGTGAYLGALWGALWMGGKRARQSSRRDSAAAPGVCDSGVLLVVRAQPDREELARRVLQDSGGDHVGRAPGRWRQGRWEATGLPDTPDAPDGTFSAPADRS